MKSTSRICGRLPSNSLVEYPTPVCSAVWRTSLLKSWKLCTAVKRSPLRMILDSRYWTESSGWPSLYFPGLISATNCGCAASLVSSDCSFIYSAPFLPVLSAPASAPALIGTDVVHLVSVTQHRCRPGHRHQSFCLAVATDPNASGGYTPAVPRLLREFNGNTRHAAIARQGRKEGF